MEDDQQFCLRWNNHQTTLIQNFDTLLESGTLVDCTLAAEGKYLKAHKVVLSACSPYFEGLLSEHYDKHPVFILKDVKFKELKAMMDYMYRGEVNISQDQLAALLKAAESLQIKGLSESKTGGSGSTSNKTDSRQQKVPQPTAPSLDIPHASSGLTIEKNKVPRQSLAQTSVGDLPEDSASPQLPKGISSREGSQSPTARKRKRLRRRSLGDDNPIENHETSNSSDMPHQQMSVPALGVAPVADEKSHADPTDSLGRSALMQQLTKPADEMLQMPVEKPEPNDSLIEPKSEYLEDPEESVEDLTLDDDMNDLNEMEQDNNRAGPSHDPSQHPGLAAWHVTGDRSNAGGVVSSVAGAPGATDEVFLAAQEAAQAHRDSQDAETICNSRGSMQYPSDVNYCLKDLEKLQSKKRNISADNDQKLQPITCRECKRTYTRMDSLKRHQMRNHGYLISSNTTIGRAEPPAHWCELCGRSYRRLDSLKRHQKLTCEFRQFIKS
ncbi:sex determination protein fruitless isoform X15 [Chelonus insularis]|uniref:sex determination protein fruitless isoform X15 n=1 Tax=Chelonus insularis TaxID=460826 RepID=UPI00158C6657|nr:sex determination protein fruitless isoform X15 [Chelonus insularis]